jgi:MFS family permease
MVDAFIIHAYRSSSIATTTITANARHFGQDFKLSPLIANLPYALYILGLALGFLVGAIASESLSRKNFMLISLAIFALSEMGVGLANNIIIIICLRFVAGLGGGLGILIGACILLDMYPRNARTLPHLILCGSFFIGPVAG